MEQTTEPIDAVIGQVEKLYVSLTGEQPPAPGDGPYAPIPPEKEPDQHIAEQVDRLLATLAQLSSPRPLITAWAPPLAIWQTRNDTWICCDLPGVSSEAVQVRVLSRGVIEISGERRAPRFDGEARRVYDESPRGPFRRVVSLPSRAAAVEQIEARVRDGVLEVRVPTPPGSEPDVRTVPVT
jgi:HSP20 family molecular chaperone IbpA